MFSGRCHGAPAPPDAWPPRRQTQAAAYYGPSRPKPGWGAHPALLQRDAAGVFHHGVDGVVLLEHVQHSLQTVCGGDALDGAVEIGKVHPGGLEQHLAAQLGPEQRVRAPLCRQRQGHILLDGHPEPPDVLHAPVQDAFAVDALHLAHGIPPGPAACPPAGCPPGCARPGPRRSAGKPTPGSPAHPCSMQMRFASMCATSFLRGLFQIIVPYLPPPRNPQSKKAPPSEFFHRGQRFDFLLQGQQAQIHLIPAGPLRSPGCARHSGHRRCPPESPAACPLP